jgi:hypothetical protein
MIVLVAIPPNPDAGIHEIWMAPRAVLKQWIARFENTALWSNPNSGTAFYYDRLRLQPDRQYRGCAQRAGGGRPDLHQPAMGKRRPLRHAQHAGRHQHPQ